MIPYVTARQPLQILRGGGVSHAGRNICDTLVTAATRPGARRQTNRRTDKQMDMAVHKSPPPPVAGA